MFGSSLFVDEEGVLALSDIAFIQNHGGSGHVWVFEVDHGNNVALDVVRNPRSVCQIIHHLGKWQPETGLRPACSRCCRNYTYHESLLLKCNWGNEGIGRVCQASGKPPDEPAHTDF